MNIKIVNEKKFAKIESVTFYLTYIKANLAKQEIGLSHQDAIDLINKKNRATNLKRGISIQHNFNDLENDKKNEVLQKLRKIISSDLFIGSVNILAKNLGGIIIRGIFGSEDFLEKYGFLIILDKK